MATKQEGIKELVEKYISLAYWYEGEKNIVESLTKGLIKELAKKGAVIKVGEISDDLAQTASQPETYYADKVGMSWERTNHIFKAFKEAGYVAVEPLIKEVKDG